MIRNPELFASASEWPISLIIYPRRYPRATDLDSISQAGRKFGEVISTTKKPEIVCEFINFMPRRGPRSRRNTSIDYKKIKILSHLFSHSEGANKNTIEGLPGLNSIQWNDLQEILIDLCSTGIVIEEHHDEIRKGAVIYKITESGRNFVEKLRQFQNEGFGEGFD